MKPLRDERGITLMEVIISLALLLIIFGAFGGFVVESSRINKQRQTAVDVQSTARNCLSLVVQTLRTAGWDPMNAGIVPVTLDSDDLSDGINEIEVWADIDEDGTLDDEWDERVLIRHVADRLEWRRTSDTSESFEILGVNVTNDHDGDGVTDLMFVPDSSVNPSRVTVTITAESPYADLQTGKPIRYTVSSDVVFRKEL